MMEKIPAAILEDLALPAGLSLRAWAEADLETIQRLSAAEGWTTPAEWPVETLEAWRHSWPALVVPPWRGRGLGKLLIEACHKLQPAVRFDLLSTEEADGFYQHLGFRPFQGYRKSYH